MQPFKLLIAFFALTAAGCSESQSPNKEKGPETAVDSSINGTTGTKSLPEAEIPAHKRAATDTPVQAKSYSNNRFKDVTVTRLGVNKFRINGKGQIFEAGFGWYIEDGHNELKTGFATTNAGAPEWGMFELVIDSVVKKRPNSTLHLVLFETSAKDGSRQYELPIPLY